MTSRATKLGYGLGILLFAMILFFLIAPNELVDSFCNLFHIPASYDNPAGTRWWFK